MDATADQVADYSAESTPDKNGYVILGNSTQASSVMAYPSYHFSVIVSFPILPDLSFSLLTYLIITGASWLSSTRCSPGAI